MSCDELFLSPSSINSNIILDLPSGHMKYFSHKLLIILWICAVALSQVPYNFTRFVPKGSMRNLTKAAIGTHPRLLFTEADRSELVARVTNDSFAKLAYNSVFDAMSKSLLNPSTPMGLVYASLSQGIFANQTNFTRALSGVSATYFDGFDNAYSRIGIGGFFNFTGGGRSLYSALATYSYALWLRQNDSVALRNCARAVATASRQHHLIYPGLLSSASLSTPKYYDVELALAYDLMYNWMNGTERNNTRNFISYLTKGKNSIPGCFAGIDNQAISSLRYALSYSAWFFMTLAIEGEPGYDNSSMITNCACMVEYLSTYGLWNLCIDLDVFEVSRCWIYCSNGSDSRGCLWCQFLCPKSNKHLAIH